MARISPAPKAAWAPRFGDDAPLGARIYAQCPAIADAVVELGARLTGDDALLSARLKELVRLRIAFHNQCRSCMALRYEWGAQAGVDEDLVCSLERPEEADDLTEAERVALRYADLMATDHLSAGDELYDELREHFTEPEIVELGFAVAYFIGFGRLAASWHIVDDLPQGYRDAPKGAPVTPWNQPEVVRR
jgi:AhpD family alkylhydroperoxidase